MSANCLQSGTRLSSFFTRQLCLLCLKNFSSIVLGITCHRVYRPCLLPRPLSKDFLEMFFCAGLNCNSCAVIEIISSCFISCAYSSSAGVSFFKTALFRGYCSNCLLISFTKRRRSPVSFFRYTPVREFSLTCLWPALDPRLVINLTRRICSYLRPTCSDSEDDSTY